MTGFHRLVVEHRLQVGGALLVGSGEIGLFAVGAVGAEFHVQAPRLDPFADFRRVGLQRQFACRGDDAHGVARLQVGGRIKAVESDPWAPAKSGASRSSIGKRCFMVWVICAG